MTAIPLPTSSQVRAGTASSRAAHRRTCIIAGALAAVGGALSLLLHPGFAIAAATGGLWLILSWESKTN